MFCYVKICLFTTDYTTFVKFCKGQDKFSPSGVRKAPSGRELSAEG